MSPFNIPTRWYGVHPGGELRVRHQPRAVLEHIVAEVDALNSWEGGGVTFGRKPFLGQVKCAQFRVRPLSYRRDGSVSFLVGEVEPTEGGTLVRYKIESPVGFVNSLPFVAAAPAALFGIGGYLASPVYAPAGGIDRVALIAGCSVVGLLVGVLLIAIVMHGIRRDTERLLSFIASTIDVAD